MTRIDDATVSTESVQLELALVPLVHVEYEQGLSIEERFAIFHDANPHVADDLEAIASDWFARGNTRTSLKALYEQLRYQSGLRTTTDGGYKLNNDFTALYSRLLIVRHPEWADAIQLRERRAA